jgi:signal peptidase I
MRRAVRPARPGPAGQVVTERDDTRMGISWIRQLRRCVGLLWLALLVLLLVPVAVSHLAPHVGRTVYIIRGGSMAPTIPLGALILDVPVDPATIAVGDVITVRAQNAVVYTHRVVSIDATTPELRFEIKGDANAQADGALVPAHEVIGRVELFAPIAGFLLALLSLPSGIVSAMSMLGSLLLTYWLLEDVEREVASDDEPVLSPAPTPAPA